MPRKIVPNSSSLPYHINARCINREWFDLPMETVWKIFEDYLFLVKHEFGLRIHAFVLMSNHFHLLVSAPNANISDAMLYFMRETSKEISRYTGRINQTYGNRNHKTLIPETNYFVSSYKYIYRNPVRAGICENVEDYPYSTLRGLLGKKTLIVPVEEDTILFDPEFRQDTLEWLNTQPNPECEADVRKALRRSEFKLPRCKTTKRPNRLETELL